MKIATVKIRLETAYFEQCIRFYTALGFTITQQWHDNSGQGATLTLLEVSNVQLELAHIPNTVPNSACSLQFEVSDLDQTVKALANVLTADNPIERSYESRSLYLSDPSGNRVTLFQRIPSPQDHSNAADILDMFHDSVALIGVYDEYERLRYTNAAFRAAYFIDPDESLDWQTLMRRNFQASRGTIIKTDNIDGWISSVRSRRGKSPVRCYESDLHDGRFIGVTETMRKDGWIIYVGTDVTQLNVSQRELRLACDALFRQSFTDDLTGVSNRRHILAKLEETIDARQEAWACLIDIDHFKRVNDTYGHKCGDDVLVNLARAVRNTLKLRDAFGRVGGEEFLVIFANQSFEEVGITTRKLIETITDLVVCAGIPKLRITISGGLTQISDLDTQEKILGRADRALYWAKSAGRKQIRLATSEDDLEPPQRIF